MSYEPVDVYVKDSTPARNPLAGVVVKIYNESGSLFYTQTVTDVLGHAGFLLDTQRYQLRLYRFQTAFVNPQLINVFAAPEINTFDVSADIVVPPVATDPRLCRASGFFRRATGAVARNVDVHFLAKFNPLLLEGAAVLTERDITRTDERGFMSIDLIRCGKYDVTIQGMEDLLRCIEVPDAASVNLPDLLFPVVGSVSFTPAGPYTVNIGTDVLITPTILATNGKQLVGTSPQDVLWETDDPTICAVMDETPLLRLRAFTSGTTNLTARRRDNTIIRYPNLPIAGQPLVITVP